MDLERFRKVRRYRTLPDWHIWDREARKFLPWTGSRWEAAEYARRLNAEHERAGK